MQRQLAVYERRVCVALGQHRSTQRKTPRGGVGQGPRPAKQAGVAYGGRGEDLLTADIVALARQYGHYGYRRVTALLRDAGWVVNAKRVERIWRREGLKVPAKQAPLTTPSSFA